jgi:hypothetical protein
MSAEQIHMEAVYIRMSEVGKHYRRLSEKESLETDIMKKKDQVMMVSAEGNEGVH